MSKFDKTVVLILELFDLIVIGNNTLNIMFFRAMQSSLESKFCICTCFITKNYFVKKFNVHVDYFHDEKIHQEDLHWSLIQHGANADEIKETFTLLEIERQRRLSLRTTSLSRKGKIQDCYKPLYPEIYRLKEEIFHPEFLKLMETVKSSSSSSLLDHIQSTRAERVYRFPIFTDNLCDKFVEELLNFEQSDMPKGRPNTMNNYGILLDELGFDDYFFNTLRNKYMMPIAAQLFPEWVGSSGLDSHKVFTVKYHPDEDVDLDYHYDNAEISLNISIGSDFDGGSLYFGKMNTEAPIDIAQTKEVKHRKGWALIHRGQQLHGALPIDDGERHNIIMWMRSSSKRNELCPMCNEKPILMKTEGFGDGFTVTSSNRPSTTEACKVL